jgi:DNA-binding NtrC family response regulator
MKTESDKKRCVLLVDDEQPILDFLVDAIEELDIEVLTATSGKKAIELAKSRLIDVVVLDLHMVPMDGIETLKELMQIRPDVVSVFLTGHASPQAIRDALRLGAVDFIDKPVSIDMMVATVRRSLERAWMRKERRLILEALLYEYTGMSSAAFQKLTMAEKADSLKMVRSIVEVKMLRRDVETEK